MVRGSTNKIVTWKSLSTTSYRKTLNHGVKLILQKLEVLKRPFCFLHLAFPHLFSPICISLHMPLDSHCSPPKTSPILPWVRIWIAESKLVFLFIFIKSKCKWEDIVVVVFWWFIIINIGGWNPLPATQGQVSSSIGCHCLLPLWSRGGPHYWCHTKHEQVPGLAQVDNIEDYPLVYMNIVHWEVKPEPG